MTSETDIILFGVRFQRSFSYKISHVIRHSSTLKYASENVKHRWSAVWQVGTDIWIGGIDCDVSSPASVQRLADGAASQMGSIDVWINNAGYSGSFQVFSCSACHPLHNMPCHRVFAPMHASLGCMI
jgi:NAD(P)-dependent dehydrogenase (short-subunit alcohol dehydrogenase family)